MAKVYYGQARRASKPHQDQPQQAAAFLMHQDTSLTTTIEHPQGKRQGQPQQAAAFLTLPGAGGLPDSRKHHTPGRLLSPLGYPGPERVSAVQKPPSRGRRTPDKQQTSHQVYYGQARRASKPHQDQPQQAAAFLMHQDTSLTTTIEHPPGQETGPAAASCCLPDSARGRRTAGQPQAPHSRPVVVTVRLPPVQSECPPSRNLPAGTHSNLRCLPEGGQANPPSPLRGKGETRAGRRHHHRPVVDTVRLPQSAAIPRHPGPPRHQFSP
ncbi:hypothetical protein Q5P01_000362 [Channa striata]|uniref:Uncharacterized protein n=1 Tax=Channa striata TaxID=64152 RepID=A0AA88IDM2_CHASR|nr:hypothetical protein Q5P01_000362 [Channa striata]